MLTSVPGLAKLTRPRLFGAIARSRLFDFLDHERERRAICVVGPPGAGKTTLVASYLDSHALSGIWYQVDAGDADLATFFYYLGLAAAGWQGERPSLPLLTAEYAHDIVGFTRRFFRELFARLPRPATIVLDNYQEVPIDSLLHEVVAVAVDELPVSLTLFAISRAHPPAHYARLIANQNVALLEWEALKLTLEETHAIVTARTGAGLATAERLHERSGGWVAALTLLIERGGDAGERVDGMARIFDYFAGQIFSRVEPSVQRFLVATALLPRLTPDMAQALTGHADAAEILERLYQRNLFTHRRNGSEPTYQYHALFQAFLLARGKQLLDDAERRMLAVRAGGLLVSVAMPEEAFGLFVQAQAWDAATSVLCGHAQSLLAQGRDQTVRDWASRLPEEQAARPLVRYWIGMAIMLGDPAEARRHVELAWHGFVAVGDIPGQMLAASAMIESYYREWRQFRPLDRWIEVLEDLLARGARPSATEAQLRVYANLLLAMMYRRPGHPSIGAHARKVLDLLERDAEINERVIIGAFLLSYCAPAAEMTLGARVVALIEPLAVQPQVRPHHRYLWRGRRAFFYYFEGDYVRGLEQVAAAEAIARAEGFALHLNYMHYRLINLCALDRVTAVTELCDAMVSVIDTTNPQQNWHLWQLRLDEAVVRGDATNADELGDQGLAAARLSGLIFLELRTSLAHAWLLAQSGREADLEVLSARVRDTIAGTCYAYFEHDLLMCQAWCLINAGQRQRAQLTLRTAFARAQRVRAVFVERWNARAFRELLAEALESGIETDYVRRLIRRYAVQPPAREVEAWPWSVRLYTLGRFEVFRDDEAITFTGKAPRKVLALLKAIIAFGGTQVPQQQILDALWPQDEADLAHKSLGVALARLRKLLGAVDTVLMNDQRLSINPQSCWVDTWAFRRFVARAEQEYDKLDEDRLIQCAERAVHLYGGVFLPDDLTEPWAVQPRSRLQRRFAHFVEHLAGRLEAGGHWHTALSCYDRALEADDLNETFYRGQMRCYGALGRNADALAVFRRLRQLLSVTLGVKPSAESESLARAISRGGDDLRFPHS